MCINGTLVTTVGSLQLGGNCENLVPVSAHKCVHTVCTQTTVVLVVGCRTNQLNSSGMFDPTDE